MFIAEHKTYLIRSYHLEYLESYINDINLNDLEIIQHIQIIQIISIN